MTLIDRLEKIARLILWLSISAVCIATPLLLSAQARESARIAESLRSDAEQTRAAIEKERKLASAPDRLPLESMGSVMKAYEGHSGMAWFTNVSARTGFTCLVGSLTNPKTQEVAESLPGCAEVHPYSSVNVKVMFAGGQVDPMCPPGACTISIKDAP